MNQDDIIRMVRASAVEIYGPMPDEKMYDIFIERCARLIDMGCIAAVAAERKACIDDCHAEATAEGIAQRIIERIRARGQS